MSKDIFQALFDGEVGQPKYHLIIRYIGENAIVNEDIVNDVTVDEAMVVIKRYADSGYSYMNFRMIAAYTEDGNE